MAPAQSIAAAVSLGTVKGSSSSVAMGTPELDVVVTENSTLQEYTNHNQPGQIYCEWTINDLKSHFETKETANLRQIVSPDFDGGRWRLLFHPQSDDKEYPSHCSLYFEAVGPGDWLWQKAFSFVAHIQPLDRSIVLATQSDDYHVFTRDHAASWGFPNMGRRDDVFFDNNASVKTHGRFRIVVMITATAETSMSLYPFSLMRAITAVLDDPDGSDVVFLIKPRAGKGRTKFLYAYSNILISRSEYFKELLEGDWQESQVSTIPHNTEKVSSSQATAKASLCNSLEDSDVELDEVFSLPQPSPLKKRRIAATAPKRQVVIEGASYRTFRGMLVWLLTNDVWLGSLLSHRIALDQPDEVTLDPVRALEPDQSLLEKLKSVHDGRGRNIDWHEGRGQRPCSPKSLYALADRYNLPVLKEQCQAKILRHTVCKNVLWEVLSPFSIKYKEIFAEQVKILIREWPNLKDSRVISTLADHPDFPLLWTAISPYVDLKGTPKV